MLHQPFNGDIGVIDHSQAGVDDLVQVVRRYVGRHAHRDAGGAVDQQFGNARGQHRRLGFGAVVVIDEIHRLLVEVGQQLVRDFRHAHFGVTHRGRRIAVDRTEVALPVDQHVAHGKRLRHAHDGVVDRGVAMGVIFTDDITDDAGRFLVGLVPVVAEFAHGVQHAAVNRFQTVAHVRQGAANDHAHRVIQIGLTHFVF